MIVDDLMSRAIFVTSPQETVAGALALLRDVSVRHLPVLDGSRVVGMLSDRDLREYRLPALDELQHAVLADELLARPVGEVMSRTFAFVDRTESIAQAIDVMLTHGVGALPVLDRPTGDLLGMISYVDVLRIARELI